MAPSDLRISMASIYKQAQAHVPEAVSIPQDWLSMYEDFISKNSSSVSQIESALRSLTYIIPGLCSSACADVSRTNGIKKVGFENQNWRRSPVRYSFPPLLHP